MSETSSAFDMLNAFNNTELNPHRHQGQLDDDQELSNSPFTFSQNQQQQHNSTQITDDELLNEFLDSRVYEMNLNNNSNNNDNLTHITTNTNITITDTNDMIKDELSTLDQDLNYLTMPVTKEVDNVSQDVDVTNTTDQNDLIHSLLSQNFLEKSSNGIEDDTDQLFKIDSSNDSNNSIIIPPQTPPSNDVSYTQFDHQQQQQNLDDMDIDYGFNDYPKVTDVQSEEFKLYEESRKELMKLKFGGPINLNSGLLNTTIPSLIKTENSNTDNEVEEHDLHDNNLNLYEVPESYYDTSNDANLPYTLKISDLPDHSRVETQIKISLSISPPPPQFLLQLPSDTISKTKLRLQEEVPESSKKHILYLDTYVLTSGKTVSNNNSTNKKKKSSSSSTTTTTSPPSEITTPNSELSEGEEIQLNPSMKSCNICSRCIRRELKRASRRKNGTLEDGFNWGVVGPKRAVIFNCKEIISFPPPTVTSSLPNRPNGDDLDDYLINNTENNNKGSLASDQEKKIEISSRIICYCRHHSESKGFRLFFVLKNYDGEILGKTFSKPIMIMDRKKSTISSSEKSIQNVNNNNDLKKDHHPLSPTSLEESSSEAQTNMSDYSRPSKRKRAWSPTATIGSGSVVSSSTYYDSITHQRSLVMGNGNNNNNNGGVMSRRIDALSPTDSEHQRSPNIFHNTPHRTESITSITSNSSSYVGNINNNNNKQQQQQQQQVSVPSTVSQHNNSNTTSSNQPYIQRIIPAQGPIRGGIEVTLLGSKFRPGLVVKFGANQALTTHCWSDSTIVTYLPPASNPGQVLVTFDNFNNDNNSNNNVTKQSTQQQVFTYTDDTDRQLIELALQIVGLKMNGKLEDAKNIAKRIIGNTNDSSNSVVSPSNNSTNTNNNNNTTTASYGDNFQDEYKEEEDHNIDDEWFSKATKTVKELSQSSFDTEDMLLKFLSLLDLPNAPIMSPNWAVCTTEGQTLLHLAAIRNYYKLTLYLINRGCRIDYKDVNEFTPLHLAFLNGNREIIEVLAKCGANLNNKIKKNVTLQQISNSNVLDLISEEYVGSTIDDFQSSSHTRRSSSNDSISSMFNDIDGSLRQHVSRMVADVPDVSTDLAIDDDNDTHDDFEFDLEEEEDDDEEEEQSDDSPFSAEKVSDKVNTDDVREEEVDQEDLPNYDDLFPSSQSLKLLIRSVTGGMKTVEESRNVEVEQESSSTGVVDSTAAATTTSSSSTSLTLGATDLTDQTIAEESEESEESEEGEEPSDDRILRFFLNNSQRTTPIMRDRMLFFFWLPLLLIAFILVMGSNHSWVFEEQFDKCNEFIRYHLLNFMLGRSRVEGMINSVNAAVTAGLNNIT